MTEERAGPAFSGDLGAKDYACAGAAVKYKKAIDHEPTSESGCELCPQAGLWCRKCSIHRFSRQGNLVAF